MTDTTTEDSPGNQPLGLPLNDQLGQAPERAAFERWTASEGGNLTRRADNPERYASATVQGRWRAWDAAMKAERARWIAKAGATYTEAHAIFNEPRSETPQEVRDVIEWHLHTMRANEEA